MSVSRHASSRAARRAQHKGAALGPRRTRGGASPTSVYLREKSAYYSARKMGQFGPRDLPAAVFFPVTSARQQQLIEQSQRHAKQQQNEQQRQLQQQHQQHQQQEQRARRAAALLHHSSAKDRDLFPQDGRNIGMAGRGRGAVHRHRTFGGSDSSNIWSPLQRSESDAAAKQGGGGNRGSPSKQHRSHPPTRRQEKQSIADVLAANMSDEDVLRKLVVVKSSLLAGLRKQAAHAKRAQNPIETMQRLFEKMDLDRSGSVDGSEFKALVHAIAPGCSDEELSVLMSTLDADASGLIDLKEIMHFLKNDVDKLQVRRKKKRYHKTLQLPRIIGATDRLLQGAALRREHEDSRKAFANGLGANNTVAGSMKGYLKRLGLLDQRARRQKFDSEMRLSGH